LEEELGGQSAPASKLIRCACSTPSFELRSDHRDAPRIADHLCAEWRRSLCCGKTPLELRGVFFKENCGWCAARLLHAHGHLKITAKGLGSQNAVCGGGRL